MQTIKNGGVRRGIKAKVNIILLLTKSSLGKQP